ncbi:MAG: spermidine synthase [Phycisphaerae bacterium]
MQQTTAATAGGDSRVTTPGWVWLTIVLIGLASGAAAGINRLAVSGSRFDSGWLIQYVLVGAAVGAVLLVGLHVLTRLVSRRMSRIQRGRLLRYEPLTYLPALLLLLGAVGLALPWLVVLLFALVLAKALAVLASLDPASRREATHGQGYLAFLFLLSGISALVYQIVWQRTLFTAFGVNIESITIIVSLFMFGLGVGSFLGGRLIRRYPTRGPEMFLVCMWGIGGFGLVSIPLIQLVAAATLHASLPVVSLVVFALLAVPTVLMGATLPILVGHLYRFFRNVGGSVGLLYSINTIGSAIACFLTADVLFVFFGQQDSVLIAAACNILVGLLVWRYARRLGKSSAADPAEVVASADVPTTEAPGQAVSRWRGPLVAMLAAAVGYISLSQEIVWMRVVSYMTGGEPTVFAHVLGWFLIGVAGGAHLAKWACQRNFRSVGGSALRYTAGMLLISGLFYYGSIRLTAGLYAWSPTAGLVATHGIVAVVAFLLGGIFPVLCHHAAAAEESVGMTVSKLYVANIVGSTAGPLVTGFVLMDLLTTNQIILALSIATLAVGVVTMMASSWRRGLAMAAAVAVLSAGLVGMHGWAYGRFFETLHRGGLDGRYEQVIENRSGVITVKADQAGDIVYGGGMYDGRFATDPVVNANLIRRCYMLAALHPDPKRTLEIGLSTGSWALVMSRYEPIEQLVIVEINPGYLGLIADYPTHKPLLEDEKVTIHIDDGRRWLNRHPEESFDVILQNTTWHWRSQITNLVSLEYLQLCKSRLNPGGVMYWNTTGNEHIPYTAAQVFRHVTRFGSFVAASDRPFDPTAEQIRSNLMKFRTADGQPVFAASQQAIAVLDELATTELPELGPQLRQRRDLEAITDDNMYTEYKLKPWFSSDWSWAAMWGRKE